jgi:chemotaxis protein CheC
MKMNIAPSQYSEEQLNALRELAHIGAGNASIAMERLIGSPIDLDVSRVDLLPLADAVAAAGPPEADRYGVVVPVSGDFDARMLLLIEPAAASILYGTFGLRPGTPESTSMLCELGNILSSAYVCSLAQTVGLEVAPAPPQMVVDMLAAILGTVLLGDGSDDDLAIVLDSQLTLHNKPCSLDVMLVPASGGVDLLLDAIAAL